MNVLASYGQGFAKAWEPWPPLPLDAAAELGWWQALLARHGDERLQGMPLVAALQAAMPQLQLPQVAGISDSDLYRRAVLRGEPLDADVLAEAGPPPCWQHPQALSLWIAPHPVGAMPVLHTPSRADFERLVRALAHRGEPVALADGVHAQAISGLIHWGLISQYGRDSRARLIVLHQAPYGSVAAKLVPGGLSDSDWLAASTTLRLEHELTHLATKRLLGEMRLNLLDELIADAMGMVQALGCFDAGLFGRCLGLAIDDGDSPIVNGRWISYVRELSADEARTVVALVMARARELEHVLQREPWLLQPSQAMVRLQWLCQQRLDQPISAVPQPAEEHAIC
ncbi:MAG: hypothetical protein FJ077_05255 [Cyanobacteria bacterium K_DeepCast_35m_m2_023]|nr:hypothetical protein [Cyanobacteria bacterium K_DeepCast_35m_m2_023]